MVFLGYRIAEAQAPPKQDPPGSGSQAGQPPDETNPPEEDEAVAPRKYVLNPLEAERNLKVGNFYWNKREYRAALARYQEATHYNPSSPEAFFKVGETQQKLHNEPAAKSAFQKVIQVGPDTKFAAEAKKKLASKTNPLT